MFRSAFHHVCNFEIIIPEYHRPLYHLISWCHDILCSSLETAVFIVLRNFESPGNFVILLITPFCILFFNMVNRKSPGKNPCEMCLKSDHLFTPFFPNALSFNPQVIKNLTVWFSQFSTVNIWSILDTCIKFYCVKIDTWWYYTTVGNY